MELTVLASHDTEARNVFRGLLGAGDRQDVVDAVARHQWLPFTVDQLAAPATQQRKPNEAIDAWAMLSPPVQQTEQVRVTLGETEPEQAEIDVRAILQAETEPEEVLLYW